MYKSNQKKIHSLTPIDIVDLSIFLGNSKILDKINCTIKHNSITAVIGPNGAGKSIFLQAVNGLTSVYNGKITFNEVYNNEEIRRKQAMVFQTPILLRRNVKANMDFVSSVNNKDGKIAIKSILKRVGLEGYDDKPARLLSGGEKQRLSLARALLIEPSVLLLDEPTANLDPFSLKLIEEIILEENKKGTTIILTTHDMAQAKRLASDIIFFNKGRMLEQTDSNTFFRNPITIEAKKYIKGEILL
jgi:tungstate transport system ATP-binding protein